MKNLIALTLSLLLSSLSYSALYDRGNGLIYDDVLDITWLQDANYAQTSGYDSDGKMNWNDANNWASNFTYEGHVDWRLPETIDIGNDGPTYYNSHEGVDWGVNLTNHSEMSHLFYESLGNLSVHSTEGCTTADPSKCLNNSSFFVNIMYSDYWSSTSFILDNNNAWDFSFGVGNQDFNSKDSIAYAWPVHDGDIGLAPVPLPAGIYLFLMGLVGLVGVKLRGRNA